MRLADAIDEALPDLSGGAVASMGSVINRSGVVPLRLMVMTAAKGHNSYALNEVVADPPPIGIIHTPRFFKELDDVEDFLARRASTYKHDPEAWDLG